MSVASVHVADVGLVRAVRSLRGPRGVAGLRHADAAIAAPLSTRPRELPKPKPGRLALVAFWDDHAALDAFVAEHPYARHLAGGWRARLEPLRAFGSWPGLDADVRRDRATPEHDGAALVTTLGRLRLPQTRRFLRTSRPAEIAAQQSDGFLWGTALARPPFVATVSVWESAAALSVYAYGKREPAHPAAIDEDRARPFHHQSAFVRFRIVDEVGTRPA
jgi:hypothetical protein